MSGQVALDPETHEVVGDTIEEQTERALSNLEPILEAAGSGLDGIVKTTVYLADWDDFTGMNGVYARYVGSPPPARATAGIELPSGNCSSRSTPWRPSSDEGHVTRSTATPK